MRRKLISAFGLGIMKLYILLLCSVLVASSLGRPNHETRKSLLKSEPRERIIEGREVTPHSIPYQVYLKFKTIWEEWECSGALISENFVLTGSWCLYGAEWVEGLLGAHDVSKAENTTQFFNSSELYLHEDYDFGTNQNDIALVKLQQPATLNQYVQTIPLASSSESSLVGLKAVATGWGLTDYFHYKKPDTLQAGTFAIVEDSDCDSLSTFNYFYDSRTALCARGQNFQGTCDDDRGAPLAANGQLVGITSVIPYYCGDYDTYPDVFTRVTSYLSWISNITGLALG